MSIKLPFYKKLQRLKQNAGFIYERFLGKILKTKTGALAPKFFPKTLRKIHKRRKKLIYISELQRKPGFLTKAYTRSTFKKSQASIEKLRQTAIKQAQKLKTPWRRKEALTFLKSKTRFAQLVRIQQRNVAQESKYLVADKLLASNKLALSPKHQRLLRGYLTREELSLRKLKTFFKAKDPEQKIVRYVTRTQHYKNQLRADNVKLSRKISLKDALRKLDDFYEQNRDLIILANKGDIKAHKEVAHRWKLTKNERAKMELEI